MLPAPQGPRRPSPCPHTYVGPHPKQGHLGVRGHRLDLGHLEGLIWLWVLPPWTPGAHLLRVQEVAQAFRAPSL